MSLMLLGVVSNDLVTLISLLCILWKCFCNTDFGISLTVVSVIIANLAGSHSEQLNKIRITKKVSCEWLSGVILWLKYHESQGLFLTFVKSLF